MKKLRYFSVLMLVAILALTGCTNPLEKKVAPEDRLEKALNKLNEADNFTMKLKLDAKASSDGETAKIKADLTAKVDAKKGNAYINVDLSASSEDDDYDLNIEAYSVLDDDEATVYVGYDDEWYSVKADLEDMGLDIDITSDSEVDMKYFKDIKEVETKKGVTKIEAKIDAKKVLKDVAKELNNDDFDYEEVLDEVDFNKIKIYFYIDKNDNITKIEYDFGKLLEDLFEDEDIELDKFTMEMSIEDIGKTEVKVPSKVKNNATEMDLEDLIGPFLGYGYDWDNGYDYDYDYEYNYDDDDDDWTTRDVMYDILLTGTALNYDMVVDFKNYNGEMTGLDSGYDVKRVTEGKVKFLDGNFEILSPFVIDGKTCRVGESRMDIEC